MLIDKELIGKELEQYIKENFRPRDVSIGKLLDGSLRHAVKPKDSCVTWALDFLLKKIELSFSEKLIELIEKKGQKPSEVYNKVGVTRAHFAKIKADNAYHPTKETALAFAIALHLDLGETNDLLKRAGYSISHSSESDIIVEFFISRGIYNIDEINNQLYLRGHKPLTNWRKTQEKN